MSGVVLRCPSCGTTQAATGECEACHEADVRYFCPNHAPGLWLDGPRCPECGAGVQRARPAPPPPPRRRTPTTPSLDAPRPAPPPPPEPEPWPTVEEAWDPRLDPADLRRLEELGLPVDRHPRPRSTIVLPSFGILGCLGRLVMYAVVAAVLLAMGTCWFLGGGAAFGAAHGAEAARSIQATPLHPLAGSASPPSRETSSANR